MKYRHITYVMDGESDVVPVPFRYLSENHLYVTLEGVRIFDGVQYDIEGGFLRLFDPPAEGSKVRVERRTSPSVLLKKLRTGDIGDPDSLDTIFLQVKFLNEEAEASAAEADEIVKRIAEDVIGSDEVLALAAQAATLATQATTTAAEAALTVKSATSIIDSYVLPPSPSDYSLAPSGLPLINGATYFNTSINRMKVRSDGEWVVVGLPSDFS